MKNRILLFLVTCIMVMGLASDLAAQTRFQSLNYLYSITGSKIVSGQHNDQKDLDAVLGGGATNQIYWTERVHNITGKYPGLYGADFLFHGSNQLRWDITYESERQWNAGAMVNLMWHACPPVQAASCGWDGGIKSQLSQSQWNELLTNGTNLNNIMKARIDEISVYLQYLEDKGVEVLWRPFHEQNQTVFWWNSGGAERTKALWRMTHDYMTNVKGLSNLIWVWDMQDMSGNFADWNPGAAYFDIAAVDIYGDGFTNLGYYNSLVTQAAGKPVAIGECFRLPNATVLQNESKMSFFMNWAYGLKIDLNNPPRETNSDDYIREVYNNPRVITRDEMPGWGPNVPANLATNKNVFVSSTEVGVNVAANAVDGKYGSRWSSLYTDAQWLYVDLGGNYNVNRVKITWESAYGKDYKVQVSSDASNWSDIKSITNNSVFVNDHLNLSGVGRYVRILGLVRGSVYGYSMYELEVYGTPVTVNQPPTISLTSPTNNSSFASPASITISANASDSDGLVSKVDFYHGTTLLASDNTAPYTFSWTNVAPGTYSITAIATDNSSAMTTSSAIMVTVTNPIIPSITKVVAYVANWIDLNSYSATIDYSKVTHINIAFENPNSNGDLSFNGAYATLIQRAHANNVKVYMSIAGGSASGDQSMRNLYFSLISDSRRASFVSKLVNYIQVNNFDGLDVDLEGPAINADYGKFIADLSAGLKPINKGLSAALSQGYGGGNVPSSTFPYFDFVNIMAYDATGPWSPSSPGQHSSFDFAKSNVEYWLNRGLPRNKAILGVPFYGYGFGSASGEWPYSKIVTTYPGAENVDQAGNTIWYNGIPTIKAKTNYAFDQSLGGIMIWELSEDATGAKSLLLAIDQVIKLRDTNPVPDNLAKNKSVTVSSTEVGVNVASNAVDGSYGSRWSSLYTDAQWLYTDLGANYNINRVKITWEAAYGKDYKVQVSSDATSWIDLKSITNNSTLVNDHLGLSGSGRFVRILGVTRGTVYGYSIFELEVYGTIPQSPYSGIAKIIPGTIQAEEYDLGGEGVAYHDLSSGNSFNVFRNDGVDVENCTDTGGGYNIGSVAAGEWLEYSIDVASSGNYDILSRIASTSSGRTFHIELDGVNITGAMDVPNTGGWQTWTTISKSNVALTAGKKIMRVYMDSDLFNLNYITIRAAGIGNQSPVVSITSPVNNAELNAGSNLTITASAFDADGNVTKVDFFNGAVFLGSDDTAPYSFLWNTIAAGTYIITARATDNNLATTTSGNVTVKVNPLAVNQSPVVSITSPLNNASFNAPATISISANASDADGSISKVEFFNGTIKIGEDVVMPYNFTWLGVATGTYNIQVKAIDDKGAASALSTITILVKSSNTCSGIAAYLENGGYQAGSKVQNTGGLYECKPWPYSGWCNGSAWAYAPGTGSYWQDAWSKIGTCQSVAKQGAVAEPVKTYVGPNPSSDHFSIKFNGPVHSMLVVDMHGVEVYKTFTLGTELAFGETLKSGLYFVILTYSDGTVEKLSIQKTQ